MYGCENPNLHGLHRYGSSVSPELLKLFVIHGYFPGFHCFLFIIIDEKHMKIIYPVLIEFLVISKK